MISGQQLFLSMLSTGLLPMAFSRSPCMSHMYKLGGGGAQSCSTISIVVTGQSHKKESQSYICVDTPVLKYFVSGDCIIRLKWAISRWHRWIDHNRKNTGCCCDLLFFFPFKFQVLQMYRKKWPLQRFLTSKLNPTTSLNISQEVLLLLILYPTFLLLTAHLNLMRQSL